MSALPEYRVRRSKRAKYIAFTVQASGMVEIRLPMGVAESMAEVVMRDHQEEIMVRIAQMRLKHDEHGKPPALILPDTLHLPCLNQDIPIQRIAGEDNAWQWDGTKLQVWYQQEAHIPIILRAYLKDKGKQTLPPLLAGIAQEMQEDYQSVRIKWQKTRWGSCSSQRRINLNAKLLLLPTELVRHVMIHELAHLKHLNHSSAFWQHVANFDPEYQDLRQALRDWEQQAPSWLWMSL